MTGDEIQKLLEPTIERLGYELTDLEVRLSGKGGLLRLTIDKPGGIDLDDCQKVSQAASALLDVEDPVLGEYNLEVSSPGLDWKITKVEHFQRFEGETLKVSMRFPIEGRAFVERLVDISCTTVNGAGNVSRFLKDATGYFSVGCVGTAFVFVRASGTFTVSGSIQNGIVGGYFACGV